MCVNVPLPIPLQGRGQTRGLRVGKTHRRGSRNRLRRWRSFGRRVAALDGARADQPSPAAHARRRRFQVCATHGYPEG